MLANDRIDANIETTQSISRKNNVNEEMFETPLTVACFGTSKIVKLLLLKANVNAPFHKVIHFGLDPSIDLHFKIYPLYIAKETGNRENIQLLANKMACDSYCIYSND